MQYAYELGPEQSDRIIDQAIRHRAPITLEPSGWTDGTSLSAVLRESADGLLRIENGDDPQLTRKGLMGMHVDGRMTLGPTLYLFDSHVVDVRQTATQTSILLAHPVVLHVAQRRHSRRVTFRKSCAVHLTLNATGRTDAVTGDLLNLSPDGLACRLDEVQADSIRPEQMMRVAFQPDECQEGFEFDALPSNVCPAGTPGRAILGVQFKIPPDDERAQADRERLRDLLYARSEASVLQGSGS